MRLLIDAHQLGMRQTGNETWCRNIVRNLESALTGHEIHVAVTEQGVPALRQLTSAPHHIVSANALRRVAIDVPAITLRARVDAVLAQYTILPTRAASVVMIHDLSPLDRRAHEWLSLRFRFRFRASVELSTRTAAVVLAPSQFTRQQLIETFSLDPNRVRVAPNAVDPELGALLDAPRPARSAMTTVLSVGNVLPRKNLVTVARAVRNLQLKGLPIKYRVIGHVGRRGLATERQLRRILPDIAIVGYLSREDLARQYRSASMLAFPSMFEGFGIPAVEAMRARLPVVCSDSTSLPEVAGEAGILVPAGDVDAWEAAIGVVSTDAATRRRLSRRGHARALRFQWGDTARVVADALVTAGAARQSLPAMGAVSDG